MSADQKQFQTSTKKFLHFNETFVKIKGRVRGEEELDLCPVNPFGATIIMSRDIVVSFGVL